MLGPNNSVGGVVVRQQRERNAPPNSVVIALQKPLEEEEQ